MSKSKEYTPRSVQKDSDSSNAGLIFGRKNYMFIIIGTAFIFIGMALMTGGHMPSPDVWDESLIYSHRRITLAPIVILIGLALNVYAIFVKK